jgi:hypothetical protein
MVQVVDGWLVGFWDPLCGIRPEVECAGYAVAMVGG